MLKISIFLGEDGFEFDGAVPLADVRPLVDLFFAYTGIALQRRIDAVTARLAVANLALIDATAANEITLRPFTPEAPQPDTVRRVSMLDFTELEATVTETEGVQQSAAVLMGELFDEVEAQKDDPAAIQAIVDRGRAANTKLAAAIASYSGAPATPVDPPPPTTPNDPTDPTSPTARKR